MTKRQREARLKLTNLDKTDTKLSKTSEKKLKELKCKMQQGGLSLREYLSAIDEIYTDTFPVEGEETLKKSEEVTSDD